MKIRIGFVSNSSTSSFVCEICGATEAGYDASPEDCGFYRCVNDHIFCQEEAIGDEIERDEDHSVSEKNCPICSFECISNSDMHRYLQKEHGITNEEVFAEIKKVNKRRKVLRSHEYVQYVCKKFNITEDSLLTELKSKFKKYSDIFDYLRG